MMREHIDTTKYREVEFKFDKKKNTLSQAFITLFLVALYTTIYILKVNLQNVIAAFFDSFFLLEILVLTVGIAAFMLAALFLKSLVLIALSETRLSAIRFKLLSEVQKPYCTTIEAVGAGGYILALAVYIFTLGVAPFLTALLTRDFIFVFAALICLFFVSGDILMLFKLLGYIGRGYVIDYESVYLFTVYQKQG